MSFIYPNIVPENNLRLPDALTIKHGPARLLSRFILAADKAARRKGILLRIRHDFDELVRINENYSARGLWYPLVDAFNPHRMELTPQNSFWLSGETADGEIVVTNACRIYNWLGTNLAEQARALWYGEDQGQPCIVTADAAERIGGVVAWGGASWVRPDYRGQHLSHLVPRVLKAYACARWPIEWSICYIGVKNVSRGLAASYGHKNLSFSITYPGSALGEMALAYTPVNDFYAELASFLDAGSVIESEDMEMPPVATGFEHIVTKTSSEGVFQGSISRS
jgi:hypothetical protein